MKFVITVQRNEELSNSRLDLSSKSTYFVLFNSFNTLSPFSTGLSQYLYFSLSINPASVSNLCFPSITNTRASGSDDALRLVPPIQMSLEKAIEFIQDDELVEVTPKSIRLRKKILDTKERERANRNK